MAKYVTTYPIKRLTNQFGKGAAGQAAGRAAARNVKPGIKSASPVKTGGLKRSVKVKAVVKTDNPRLEVETRDYGLYQDKGTRSGVPRTGFVTDTVKQNRDLWEAAGRKAGVRKQGK